jgi:hypothetical protein
MAKALKTGYVYSSTQDPIELGLPIWKLQTDRPADFDEIIHQFKLCSADFKTLISALDSHAVAQGEARIEPATFMSNCCSAHVSFGWLLEMCLNHLPFNSEVVSLLRDLQVC